MAVTSDFRASGRISERLLTSVCQQRCYRLSIMGRSNRMFEVIQVLRGARKPLTAQDLAERLEVNKRTIYRDIASLQAMRIPIEGEAGIGYVMRRGFDLPPL